jgi:hypothetical protein
MTTTPVQLSFGWGTSKEATTDYTDPCFYPHTPESDAAMGYIESVDDRDEEQENK